MRAAPNFRAHGRNRGVKVIAASRRFPHNGRMPRRVVFVAYPRITALDLVGPHEVLGAAGGYALEIAAPVPGLVRTTRGPDLAATRTLTSVRGDVDTLVVVGGEGAFDAANDKLLVKAVQRIAVRSRRIASVRTGSIVLAAAGLLDGKRATTHWNACDYMVKRFPNVAVEPDP